MANKLTLNCDLGESYGAWRLGTDADVMPLIDCANIACGFHAGDPSVIRETLRLARKHKVEIGAHVAYPDLQGFGRRSMALSGQELIDCLHYQIAALDGMARVQGRKVTYVKPHGALYNDMMKDRKLLDNVMTAVSTWHKSLDLVVQATAKDKKLVPMAFNHGLSLRFEAFADRAYTPGGYLVARSKPGAVLSPTDAVTQARAIADGTLRLGRGKKTVLAADTLCVHGDSPGAFEVLSAVRAAFRST